MMTDRYRKMMGAEPLPNFFAEKLKFNHFTSVAIISSKDTNRALTMNEHFIML